MGDIRQYGLADLKFWSEKIEKIAVSLGLDYYPQEFEVIDYMTMLERMTYSGMLSFYPTWSAGKNYELNSLLYRTGLQYLPYELVVATNPCLACLLNSNDLAMQILTMSHVYGHNNFFKNNIYFKEAVETEKVTDFFSTVSEKIRGYENDPSIGPAAVRKCVDAAQSLRWQCPEIQNTGNEKGDNLLKYLRDNSPRDIKPWEKYIIDTVITAFDYVYRPNLITLGMNEGWATYCHYKIMYALKLSPELRFAFARHHSKVVRLPDNPTDMNPYLINFMLWNKIEKKFREEKSTPSDSSVLEPILPELKEIMRSENDAGFIDKYLDESLARELGLFVFQEKGQAMVAVNTMNNEASSIKEGDNFRQIKHKIIRNLAFNQIPVIKVSDRNYEGKGFLYLKHIFEGRHLEWEFSKHTLEHINYFWQNRVMIETRTFNRHLPFIFQYDGQRHTQFRRR